MTNFVKTKGCSAVNLDLVTHVSGCDDDKVLKLYFEFDSMIEGEIHESTWSFESLEHKKRVIKALSITEI
jgi:hypothetical protein